MTIRLIIIFFLAASPAFGGEGKQDQYLRQGAEYLEAQQYQRAVKTFQSAARLNPASVEAQKGLGIALLKSGSDGAVSYPDMLQSAATALREAARLDPASAATRYHLGLTYLALHDKENALKEHAALKELDPTLGAELHARIRDYRPPVAYRSGTASQGSVDYVTGVAVSGNHVFVPVTLSHRDRTVEAKLILDTGASVTVISTGLARRLEIDLERMPRTRARVVGGGTVTGWQARLDRVSAGPHSRSDITVAVIPQYGGFPLDGLLGMDFLRRYKYHIDFDNRVIEWARP